MILLAHLLFGAAIGHIVKNMPGYPLGLIILAFLSHYFLDMFPHIEYNIENIEKKQWRRALPQFLAVGLDFLMGVLLIFIFSNPSTISERSIIYVCAFFAILPDGLTILNDFLPNKILETHNNFHQKIIHFLKNKKISNFWRIASQAIVVIISSSALLSSFF